MVLVTNCEAHGTLLTFMLIRNFIVIAVRWLQTEIHLSTSAAIKVFPTNETLMKRKIICLLSLPMATRKGWGELNEIKSAHECCQSIFVFELGFPRSHTPSIVGCKWKGWTRAKTKAERRKIIASHLECLLILSWSSLLSFVVSI